MHLSLPLLIVIAVSFILWIIYFLIKNFGGGSVVKNYKKIGDIYNTNVDYTQKKLPVAAGKYRNRDISIGSFTRTNGKNSQGTFIKVSCSNPENLAITLQKKNKLSRNGNFISTGDSEFDEKFALKTNNPDKAIDILDYTIKFKLLQAANLNYEGEITLDGNTLSYSEPGLIKSDSSLLRIELLLHVMSDIADDLNIA